MYVNEEGVLISVSRTDLIENTLILPQSVKKIGREAIKNLPDLEEIVFPKELTEIGEHSISGTGIIRLTVPETVQVIGYEAFRGNEWLTIVKIPNVNTKFDGTAFIQCRSLNIVQIGAVKHQVRCLKFDVCYEVLAKKRVDVYQVYLVEPFKESARLGKLYVACKQGYVGDGVTIERAMQDCHNQYMTPDIKKAYKDITLDTLVNSHDYKRITGACDEGIMDWMKKQGFTEETTMSVRELLKILGNAYGSKIFAQFIADRYEERANEAKS